MGRMREKAAYTAMEAGHFIDNKDPKRYTIIREYPPHKIPRNIWREMYKIWGSEKWQKKSIAGKRNRASADRSGKRSRHTGGSVGFDEHRIRLKTKLGWEPSFGEVFLETHLTKESKVKLWAGELQINNMEGMNFCTARARKAYEAYLIEMKTLYGPSFTKDDPAVWARVNAGGRWNHVYGIGSTDINHLMTGNLSTSYVPELYQDKIRALETQIQESEARLESERKAMDEALQAQREVDRKSREEDLQSKLEDFIRNGCSKD
ncbi:hypothetical protein QVD17_20591 [Tagetes erecta]|uniref:Transposase, Ptta/En/Spm, plant n=1 Tax=Tagetes erecta TaxID=13708 RepID=A0AAD8KPF7_TARER|nr:hypothetical protein QVD17_20591 [Tagetes erecta]